MNAKFVALAIPFPVAINYEPLAELPEVAHRLHIYTTTEIPVKWLARISMTELHGEFTVAAAQRHVVDYLRSLDGGPNPPTFEPTDVAVFLLLDP